MTDTGIVSETNKVKLWDISETINGTGGNPNVQSAACQYFVNTETQSVFDHMQVIDDANVRVVPDGSWSAGGGDGMAVYWLSYVQVKSLELREVFDADRLTLPASSYRAEEVVRSQDEIRLPDGTRDAYRRPRCLWVGPQGVPFQRITAYESVVTPTHYTERFVRLRDGAAEGVTAFQAMVMPSTQDPKLEVLLNLVPYHWTESYRNDDGIEALIDSATYQAWDITVTVEHYTGGAWVSIGSQTVNEILTHYPTDPTGEWPVLQAEYSREALTTYIAGVWATGARYVLKEGQLYDRDMALIQRLRLSVPIDWDADTHEAVRVTVELQRDGAPTIGDAENGLVPDAASPYADPEDRIVAMIVGATIWERGQ
jgi:hypothetical protein